ncbi:MAG: N-acetylmuramic acid 6-phosphate etherase [Clostridia bacterium]|nr:N-acetylmuramic acid 6-phosphate etherase [Clostridia bacterium]
MELLLKKGLIVSSQALDGNPLKHPDYLSVMAQAAEKGGAVAIRANGYDNIVAMKKRVTVPVIGLNKFQDKSGTTIITPNFESAKEIAEAGSDIIALDATFRKSEIKEDVKTLIERIHNELHLPVLADISTVEEAVYAERVGADYVSTTLAGYTKDKPYAPEEKYLPDFEVIEKILNSGIKIPVIAEGRFWAPSDLVQAMQMGCYGIVIGKAITNPMAITEYFCQAVKTGIESREQAAKTEDRNEGTKDIDTLSTYDILKKINREDGTVAAKVKMALPAIANMIDGIYDNFANGGRLLYCGAGTSGRLSVADAAECSPTYGVPKDRVVATMAGGKDAVFTPSENMEDSYEDGILAAKTLAITAKDTVIGVSANGNAQFCLGFMAHAKNCGAKTVALTNNLHTKMAASADYAIEILTGAEVVKGSTRMKAGTAQKMALNMISTALFVKSGCVISNLMVNINPNNIKLKTRAVSMLAILTGKDEVACREILEKNGWSIRAALNA